MQLQTSVGLEDLLTFGTFLLLFLLRNMFSKVFDVRRLHGRLKVTFFATEELAHSVSFVKVKFQVLLPLASLRTDLAEQGLLVAMGILCVPFQLTSACKHHGTVDTREL